MGSFNLNTLEDAWEIEIGFLAQLRDGIFSETLYTAFLHMLKEIRIEEEELLPRRLVTLLWYIPQFMEWQTERVADTISKEKYLLKRGLVENELERILGVP